MGDTSRRPTPNPFHADRIADDLVGIVDYAGRVLISASPGSMYQADKLRGLRERVSSLIDRLDRDGTVDNATSEQIAAKLAERASRYTLGALLIEAGRLGGTA